MLPILRSLLTAPTLVSQQRFWPGDKCAWERIQQGPPGDGPK